MSKKILLDITGMKLFIIPTSLMNRKRQLGGNCLEWTGGTHRRSGCKRGSLREKDALIGALIMKKMAALRAIGTQFLSA